MSPTGPSSDASSIAAAIEALQVATGRTIDVDSTPSHLVAAGALASLSIAYVVGGNLSNLCGHKGAVGHALTKIAESLVTGVLPTPAKPRKNPKPTRSNMLFAESAATLVESWGYSPVIVLPLASRMLAAGEGNYSISDIALTLEAAAV